MLHISSVDKTVGQAHMTDDSGISAQLELYPVAELCPATPLHFCFPREVIFKN